MKRARTADTACVKAVRARARASCVHPADEVTMPRAPKDCGHTGCRASVRGRTYCEDHTPVAWSGGHGSTRVWRKTRATVLREEPVCRDCGVSPSIEAGHIIARSRGGSDERPNLKGQCRPCNLAQMYQDR